MAGVKIYGSQRSRARRVVWCAKELGLSYEQIEIPNAEMKQPAYRAINPNGKVPALVDGDLVLFESLAINLYLAKTYGTGALYPATREGEAQVWQWTLWAAAEVEPALGPALTLAFGGQASPQAVEAGLARLKTALLVLDGVLEGREYILDGAFSVADLNVAVAVVGVGVAKVDISYAPNVQAWLARCTSRLAAQS